jgi:hypothetical protein
VPELLDLSDCIYERITAKHLGLWIAAKETHDHGIMHYLSRQQPRRPILEKVVSCWRSRPERQKEAGVALTMSDFAGKYGVTAEVWQAVVDDIEIWDNASALDRFHFATLQFASQHKLDWYVWCYFGQRRKYSE